MSTLTVSEKPNLLSNNSLSFDERALQLKSKEKAEMDAIKREKQSPFSRWTQFNNEHTKELMILAIKHPKAHAILIFLWTKWITITLVFVLPLLCKKSLGVKSSNHFKKYQGS